MLKACILIVATFLVATEGLKCNRCFYMTGDGVPNYQDGQLVGPYKYDGSCNWNEDVSSSYSGQECQRIGTVDPVCLAFRLDADDRQLVIRDCYNQRGGVSEDDLDGCDDNELADFLFGALNEEFHQFFRVILPTGFVNKTATKQDESAPTDVCLCNEDNCNSGASVISVDFFIIAAVSSIWYNLS